MDQVPSISALKILLVAKNYIKHEHDRNLTKKTSIRTHHLQPLKIRILCFPVRSPRLSNERWVKFLPQHLLKSYKKKNPNHQKLSTVPFNGKKPNSFMYNTNIQADKNVSEWILHQFVKILGGGLWTMDPLLHGEKTPTAYEGKTPASHTLHIRAFMTKM